MVQTSKSKVRVTPAAPKEKRWRQLQRRHKAVYGYTEATNELFFYNRVSSPLGRIVAAGTGKRGNLDNRADTEKRKTLKERHYSLLMVLENSGGFYRNENGFECQLAYGDFFLGIPGIHHHTAQGAKDSWGEICVEFEGIVFDVLAEDKILSFNSPVWHLEKPAPWISRLQKLLQQPRPNTQVEIAQETTSFLLFLLEMLQAATPQQASPAPNNWFNNACIALSNDLSNPLDLASVASSLGMGYESFRLKFRRQSGMPPGQYRDLQRCKAAQDILVHTNKPGWEIALYLGFCDEQHFLRRFKKWTGLTPHAYRLKHNVSQE